MQSNLTIPKHLKTPSISRDSSLILNDNKSTTFHSRVQSAFLTPSGLRPSLVNSEIGFRSIPSSPKAPATMPVFSSQDEDQVVSRAAKSTRLMRKISAFAKNPSVDYGAKIKMVNSVEARKVQSYESARMITPKSPLNILLQSHANFGDVFGRSPVVKNNSMIVLNDELDLIEKMYSPLLIEHHKFMYFQVSCQNQPSPLVINIVKAPNSTVANSRLKVFVSKFNKRPSALSCDYTVESRNIKIYERDYKDTFDTAAYYFGIYSENKFEGKIMFFFGETLTAVKRERPHHSICLKQNWKTRAQQDEGINVEEIKQIKNELRKKRWLAAGGVNRVEQNKRIASASEKQREIAQKRILLQSRSSEALENKNMRESMKLQRKMFLVERHGIQKAVSHDERTKLEQKTLKTILHRDWILALTFPVLMKNLKKIYDEKREAFKRRQRIFLKIQLFAIRHRRKLLKKGPSLYDRLVFDIRGALELHVRSLKIVQQDEIQSVVCRLFAEYALYANTAKHIQRTHTILKKFAERLMLGRKRKQVFSRVVGLIWDKYHETILGDLSPSAIRKLESTRSMESDIGFSVLDKKVLKEEKRRRFIEYMINYSYYKFNKNVHRFRLNSKILNQN